MDSGGPESNPKLSIALMFRIKPRPPDFRSNQAPLLPEIAAEAKCGGEGSGNDQSVVAAVQGQAEHFQCAASGIHQ